MKQFLFLTMSVWCSFGFAQNGKQDLAPFGVRIFVEPGEGLSTDIADRVEGKLEQIGTKRGYVSLKNSRFVMLSKLNLIEAEVTPTAPPMHALVVELSVIIGDGINGNMYSSCSFNLKGVGKSKKKALLSALKGIRANNRQLEEALQRAEKDVIKYYENNCDAVMKKATALAGQGKFDQAISHLSGVPSIAPICYGTANSEIVKVYRRKMLRECNSNLSKAKSAWSSLNSKEASYFLSKIPEDSDCSKNAGLLGNEIKEYLLKNEEREWNFELMKYEDSIELAKEKEETKRREIEAARAVGIEYARNQPESITYNIRSW